MKMNHPSSSDSINAAYLCHLPSLASVLPDSSSYPHVYNQHFPSHVTYDHACSTWEERVRINSVFRASVNSAFQKVCTTHDHVSEVHTTVHDDVNHTSSRKASVDTHLDSPVKRHAVPKKHSDPKHDDVVHFAGPAGGEVASSQYAF